MKVRSANVLLWSANILLIFGIFALAAALVFKSRSTPQIDPPGSIRVIPNPADNADVTALRDLPNPLRAVELAVSRDLVLLIGIDAIKNNPTSHTAYLYLVGRKVGVNAYVDEPIRDGASGLEVPELAGWRLKRVVSKGAVFETPEGERTLKIAEIPAAVVAAADARSQLKYAAELYANGRVEDACFAFEVAFLRLPSHDVVYAFIKEAGVEVIVSMMNSKDEKLKMIGYRLFEMAKPGGERIRPRAANA